MNNELVKFDKLVADVKIFLAPIKEIKVTDLNTAKSALDTVKQVKTYTKMVEDKRVELVTPHNDIVKEINAYAKQLLAPLADAERSIKDGIAKFEFEQEKIRQAEARRIEEERIAKETAIELKRQKKEAEERAARIAEEKRIQSELRAKFAAEEKERKELEELFGKSDKEEKRLAAEAKQKELEAAKEAARLREEAAEKQRAINLAAAEREKQQREKEIKKQLAELETSRTKGMRKTWKFEIMSIKDLPRMFLIPDEVAIRKSILSGTREIPGVRIYEESELTVRR